MIGLALQGGGARGSYQIGAYYAFKKQKIKFDGVCGTSIGAFNGALIASGKEKELLEFWKNLSVGEILGYEKEFINKKINNEFDFSYIKMSFLNIIKIIKSRGIDIKGLEEILENILDKNALINSKMDFGICTLRIRNLKPMYIFKNEMNKERINDYILASCYLPIFKMKKKIDEHYYLDGGFYDNTPLNMLIDKGYKKIYVVELNPLINRKRKPKKEIEIIRITPRRSLGGIINHNQESICEHIKMGYYDTLRVIKKLDGYQYCFKNYSPFFYNWLTRKIDRKEMNHIMGFFHVKSKKEAVIKALEYMMEKEEIDYYKIYNPFIILKKVKRSKNKHFVEKFISQLNFF